MKKSNRAIDPSKCIVFFDFDNTIAECDVFDDMLLHFSKDDRWVDLENKWKEGKIGSRECLEGQIKGIRITRQKLDKYLAGIKLDPYFKRLISFLSAQKIETIVASDNFDYILTTILKYNEINSLKIYSNSLKFAGDRLIPHFPFTVKDCQICAHCKTKNLLANARNGSTIIYIGDGRSDICPAEYADIVFAKEYLLEYCKEKKLTHFPYKNFKDVHNYFKRSFA